MYQFQQQAIYLLSFQILTGSEDSGSRNCFKSSLRESALIYENKVRVWHSFTINSEVYCGNRRVTLLYIIDLSKLLKIKASML